MDDVPAIYIRAQAGRACVRGVVRDPRPLHARTPPRTSCSESTSSRRNSSSRPGNKHGAHLLTWSPLQLRARHLRDVATLAPRCHIVRRFVVRRRCPPRSHDAAVATTACCRPRSAGRCHRAGGDRRTTTRILTSSLYIVPAAVPRLGGRLI